LRVDFLTLSAKERVEDKDFRGASLAAAMGVFGDKNMRKYLWALTCLALLGAGCGGEYIMTSPDQLASTDGEANVVVRLQRNDFFVLALAVPDAALRFRVDDMPERAAFTDELGYAATKVPAPAETGVYTMQIVHSDLEGDQARGHSRVFVLEPEAPIVAVELDALPWEISSQKPHAVAALRRMAEAAQIIYLTRQDAEVHPQLHESLSRQGYPDGAILIWQHRRLHLVPGMWRLPKLVVDSRLVSELPQLHREFVNLRAGLCTSSLAAGAFAEAGLTPMIIGASATDVPEAVRVESWQALAAGGQ
jgi:hypothetical protein